MCLIYILIIRIGNKSLKLIFIKTIIYIIYYIFNDNNVLKLLKCACMCNLHKSVKTVLNIIINIPSNY